MRPSTIKLFVALNLASSWGAKAGTPNGGFSLPDPQYGDFASENTVIQGGDINVVWIVNSTSAC
jgi:hypothetical protein